MGDQKQSTALQKLQALGQGSEKLVRMLFLEMLPSEIKTMLATLYHATIENLKEMTDKILEHMPHFRFILIRNRFREVFG